MKKILLVSFFTISASIAYAGSGCSGGGCDKGSKTDKDRKTGLIEAGAVFAGSSCSGGGCGGKKTRY